MVFFKFLATHTSAKSSRDTRKHPKSTQRKTVAQKKESNPENKTYKKLETTWIPIFDTEAHKKKP